MDKEESAHAQPKDDWRKHKTAIGCVSLFFLPFVIGGVGSLFVVMYQFYKVQDAKSWKPVPAKVLLTDLISNHSPGGGIVSEAKVQYEYVIGKKSFIGNSISFGIERNNFEEYGVIYDKLINARVVQIYVNENDPAESVMIRDVTNAMVVLLIFSCMLNALLIVFVLPMIFKQLNPRRILIFTVVIWVLGMGKLLLHIGEIDLVEKVIVIEAKEEEYIYLE